MVAHGVGAAERTGPSAQLVPAVGWVLVTLLWGTVTLIAVGEQLRTPADTVPPVLAYGLLIGLIAWAVMGLRRPDVQAALTRWPVAIAAALLLALSLAVVVYGNIFLVMLMWTLAFGSVIVLVPLALVRIRRHALDSGIALALVLVVVATLSFPGLWFLSDIAMAARVRVMAPRLEPQAATLLNETPGTTRGDFYDPFVGIDSAGRPVAVAWIWERGQLLGSSTGVVYRPDAPPATDGGLHDLTFRRKGVSSRNRCRVIQTGWYQCAFD